MIKETPKDENRLTNAEKKQINKQLRIEKMKELAIKTNKKVIGYSINGKSYTAYLSKKEFEFMLERIDQFENRSKYICFCIHEDYMLHTQRVLNMDKIDEYLEKSEIK